jgi:hypothetical protein
MVPVHREQGIFDYVFDFGVVTELLEWKVSLLSYGVTDNFNVSSVEVGLDLIKGTNPESVSLLGSLRFELADCTLTFWQSRIAWPRTDIYLFYSGISAMEYDPTFDLIFRGDDGAVPSAAGSSPSVLQEIQTILESSWEWSLQS